MTTRKVVEAAVVDTSVFADYFMAYYKTSERSRRAATILNMLSDMNIPIHEPFLFEVELQGVLVRRIEPQRVLEMVEIVMQHVNIIREEALHNRAAEIALSTGCRAADAYFIATAKHVNAILITNDKVMKHNASKAGIDSYYLVDERDYKKLINKLKTR